MTPWITGALITLLSSTMAKRCPRLARVMSAKRRPPALSRVKFTTHCPVCPFCAGVALVSDAPSTSAWRLTTMRVPPGPLFGPSVIGSESSPGGGARGFAFSSTRWKLILAVCPSRSRMRFGSVTPGSSTTMRSSPCRVICGSATPDPSMRRRTISIDCSTAARARARSAAGCSVSVTSPSGCPATANSPGTDCGMARSAASAASSFAGSGRRRVTRLPPAGSAAGASAITGAPPKPPAPAGATGAAGGAGTAAGSAAPRPGAADAGAAAPPGAADEAAAGVAATGAAAAAPGAPVPTAMLR